MTNTAHTTSYRVCLLNQGLGCSHGDHPGCAGVANGLLEVGSPVREALFVTVGLCLVM